MYCHELGLTFICVPCTILLLLHASSIIILFIVSETCLGAWGPSWGSFNAVEVESSQERLVPSSLSSNVSSTCSEISTTAAFSTDLSQLSSSSDSSSASSSSSSDNSSHHHRDPDEDGDDSTCETRTLRDEQATPIMDSEAGHLYLGHRFLNQTQVGEYELVDNHAHCTLPDGRKSPSTPDLLYPHTHLTGPSGAANHPINQNGLPVFNLDAIGQREDLNIDVDRQQALFYNSADLLNSNISADGTTSLDETLSNIGSADHLIHGGHGNFLSVNNSRTFVHGKIATFREPSEHAFIWPLYFF